MAELDRLDREYGLGAMPTHAAEHRARRPPRTRGPVLPGLLITAILLGAVVALSPDANMRTFRRLVGLGPGAGEGNYAFMMTQPAGQSPVGYSPCKDILVEVNPQGAPDNWDELVDNALSHTSEATGLQFRRVGTTDSRGFDGGRRLNGEFPPVLVAWASSDEVPELAGMIAGVGGSTAVEVGPARLQYVTGQVVLDADDFADMRADSEMQAIVDHEFGHLVGLDHVDDRGELMNARNVGATTYGPGDLEGLERLGDVDC